MDRTGLTEVEARRLLDERGPLPKPPASRSYASIVRNNLLTLPNVVLGALGIVTVALGELADALFLGIVAANVVIGSAQEIRAKRALERLAALIRPEARVVRDGRARPLPVVEVVPGDLVALQPGDQVVADGRLEEADGLRVDESILTGESQAVARGAGDPVLSGSFAVEGTGLYTVTAVGSESYAERLAGQARAFRHPPSPFQVGLGRLIVSLVGLGIPLGIALSISLWLRDVPFRAALPTVVAAGINLVPEGLILLSSIVYVTGAIRMSRHGALVQQLNAVESLASADVVCTDKTGTLTESRLRVVELVPAAGVGGEALASSLGRFAAGTEVRNATAQALAVAYPARPRRAAATVPFSSRWRWSAVAFDGGPALVLGAPELFPLAELAGRARSESARGRRVVALAETAAPLAVGEPPAGPPPGLRLLGLVTLSEDLRPSARETVAYFRRESVELKVISGDAPQTVAAIAADAGIPAQDALDGGALPEDGAALQALLRKTSVVGRISPEGKRRIVEALRDDGRYVAMIGDGVNDVPALKASRIAIAQGTGSQMARTVADLVLVEGDFAAVPRMVGEGRRILRNMQRVSKVYAAKALVGAFVVIAVGLAPIPYPFLPRQLSLASFFVTGVPPFFLALAPSSGPWRMTSYVREVVGFALPAACSVGAGVTGAYALAYAGLDLGLEASRTVSVSVFVAASLYVIFALEATDRLRAAWVGAMCLTLLGAYGLVFAVPPLREVFAIVVPGGPAIGAIGLGVAVAAASLTALGIRPSARPGRAAP